MNLPKHRLAAFGVAALILLGGVLLLTFPATESVDTTRAEPAEEQAEEDGTAAAPLPETTDYGAMLLKMVISVAVVCALAYAILRWGLRRIAGDASGSQQMEVLGRLGVGPDRAIMVVRVGPRFLVIGSAETGISILTELSEEEARQFADLEMPED